MPRETVVIPLFEHAGPFEGAAHVLSYISYPDALDKNVRITFAAALCRFAHLSNIRFEEKWGSSLHLIRPWIFMDSDAKYEQTLRRGLKLLGRRLTATFFVLHPHFDALATGNSSGTLGGMKPNLANSAAFVMPGFGWHGDSASTFKSTIWGPVKPVSHMAYMMAIFYLQACQSKEYSEKDLFGALFPAPNRLSMMIIEADKLRPKLLEMKQFKFKESDLVKFDFV
jgi:hypothetical protein